MGCHQLLRFAAYAWLAGAACLQTDVSAASFLIVEQVKVQNDLAEVLLAAEARQTNRNVATLDVDEVIAWALSYHGAHPGVVMSASSLQAAPRYDSKSEQRLWAAQRKLKAESGDMEMLGRLVKRLVARLGLERMRFKLSEKKRGIAEAALMKKAIARFKIEAPQAVGAHHDSIEITTDNLAHAEASRAMELLTRGGPLTMPIEPGYTVIRIQLKRQ